MEDRVNAVCDLLMGAAFADKKFDDAERKVVEEHLASLMPDGKLGEELTERIAKFAFEELDPVEMAAKFSEDSKEDRIGLIEIISSVSAADEEYDFAEDEYLLTVAAALKLSREDVAEFALEYEVETLRAKMAKLRPAPPSIPKI